MKTEPPKKEQNEIEQKPARRRFRLYKIVKADYKMSFKHLIDFTARFGTI